MSSQPRLDFEAQDPLDARDASARALAVDPRRNVALEASAGTGKTRVLVDRYVGLLLAGVKPRNILAITFTRKAAAEMRQRILSDLQRRRREGSLTSELWREIRDSITDISISTIDAFCLQLLREFPLEAEIDPGFELADETETPRLVSEALERTLRIGRGLAVDSPEVALLFAELGEYRLREGLARLIDRRLVAWDALNRFLRGRGAVSIDDAVAHLRSRIRAAFNTTHGGVEALIGCGPDHADFRLMARDLRQLVGSEDLSPPLVQALLDRVRGHLLTQQGEPRKRTSYRISDFRSRHDYDRHNGAVVAAAPYLADALQAYRLEINTLLAGAARQLYAIALDQYRRTLRKHGVLDFSDVLERTLALLAQMDEFSRSRYKLESRYQHVLVDEFQDTSRAQWALVELLVRSWAEGAGVGDKALPPSIFIVGDRKQSIYAFRDAEVAVMEEAARYIEALRPIGQVRTAITRSFRSVREILAFVNDVFLLVDKSPHRADAFRYGEDDVFPIGSVDATESDAIGFAAAASDAAQADVIADEIARLLLEGATVRDRDSGVRRTIRPGDIGILFRTRESHRVFEDALRRRRIPYYVYKGLGFFDADEIKDVLALIGYLAVPQSQLRTAAFLRSRFVRLSDASLKLLAPDLAGALTAAAPPPAAALLDAIDQERLALARLAVPQWLALADRLPPAELLDRVLAESAYYAEIAGPSYRQARENIKKVRSLVRRMQNRGYATLERIVDYFSQLVSGGDESNAIVDAVDAVSLMTVHAAKGLEFPVVFTVNITRGSGGIGDAIRVTTPSTDSEAEPSVAIGEHQSDADKDADAREMEESKRLLYVALTRARDRLYMTATLAPDGRFAPAKGSIGRVLPAQVCELFAQAMAPGAAGVVEWRASGGTHRIKVIGAAETPGTAAGFDAGPLVEADDLTQLPIEDAPRRVAATDAARGDVPVPVRPLAAASSLEAGVLVHRAIQRGLLLRDGPTRADLSATLRSLIRSDERALVADEDDLIVRAADACDAIGADEDLRRAIAESRRVYHELPFSLRREDGTIVRGAIDLLLERGEGALEIVEFKTGQGRSEHHAQLAVYLEAARALFPGAAVSGRVVYARRGGQLSTTPGV